MILWALKFCKMFFKRFCPLLVETKLKKIESFQNFFWVLIFFNGQILCSYFLEVKKIII